jgi:hypothetical protein
MPCIQFRGTDEQNRATIHKYGLSPKDIDMVIEFLKEAEKRDKYAEMSENNDNNMD